MWCLLYSSYQNNFLYFTADVWEINKQTVSSITRVIISCNRHFHHRQCHCLVRFEHRHCLSVCPSLSFWHLSWSHHARCPMRLCLQWHPSRLLALSWLALVPRRRPPECTITSRTSLNREHFTTIRSKFSHCYFIREILTTEGHLTVFRPYFHDSIFSSDQKSAITIIIVNDMGLKLWPSHSGSFWPYRHNACTETTTGYMSVFRHCHVIWWPWFAKKERNILVIEGHSLPCSLLCKCI